MRKKAFIPFFCLLSFLVFFSSGRSHGQAPSADPLPVEEGLEVLRSQGYVGDCTLQGYWEIDETSPYSVYSIEQNHSTTWFVHSSSLPQTPERISYGGALNLKYYSGLSYDYLRKNIPGKTINIDILIPESAVSSSTVIPNRLHVSVKSEKDGEWAEYYGKSEWANVREEGLYHFSLQVPEEPVEYENRNTFYPEHSILFSVDYFLMEGSKRHSSITYSLFNFDIEGLDIDPAAIKWQFTENGFASVDKYLPEFVEKSTFINAMGTGIDLDYRDIFDKDSPTHKFSGNLQDFFLSMSVFIPQELRKQKGTLALTIKDDNGNVRSSVKNFSSCNLEGRVFLTLPLDPFSVDKTVEELAQKASLRLRIKTDSPHTENMLPIVLEPVQIKQGQLVQFDTGWSARDPQGLGAYGELEISETCSLDKSGICVKELGGENPYQLDTLMMLKGGIDWQNPFYKVELIKEFDQPINLNNMHIEVLMSPMTDTTDVWQKPFRARVGIKDINGNLMFGPNVSLSEGLANLATLEVSTTNPIPKGLVMPDFDPEKVTSLILNFEASHAPLEPREIQVALNNLAITPREYTRTSPLKAIDFSRFQRDPSEWEIVRSIKEHGGYDVGINYPFPVIDVPENIMRVPQIYPCVGKKDFDLMHFGFSSPLTKGTAVEDFKIFAGANIDLVRLLVLGHLEGVYTFDEKGKDITGFGEGMEGLVQETAGMSVERFTEFLNKNEDSFFIYDDDGLLKGLEKHVHKDFLALLDILEQVEKETGKRVKVILALYDFLLGDGVTKEGPMRMYNVGEHPEVVTDPVTKTKAQAILWKLMKKLAEDERFYRYVALIEIMNEPANATLLATRKHFIDLLNFVGEGMYLIKDAVGPTLPVSCGFRSWPGDLRYWAPIGDGMDVLTLHYWESLESYNIDKPGLWPLDLPVSEIWQELGQKPEGRPVGMGEISPGGKLKENLFRLEKAGYDYSLVWSYSGHDGHNAKPVMKEIADYQAANRRIAKLRKDSADILPMAFDYMLQARKDFDSGKISPNARTDDDFFGYLASKVRPDTPDRIEDPELRGLMAELLLVVMFKKISLSADNIEYLKEKTMRGIK
ncbi:MAG: hypothetical protein GF408_01195 [Candidatus Omnitrophica bacterium]|nr:hypothetical protein [Candidatus Omnitrophota bacterium]